jgi:hypothetical protein
MVVLFLFAITDNPIVYTAQFMTPLVVILGLSDSRLSRRQRRPEGQPHPRQAVPAAPAVTPSGTG